MCILEHFMDRREARKLIKDNEYVINFLQHAAQFSDNDVDDGIIKLIKVLLYDKRE